MADILRIIAGAEDSDIRRLLRERDWSGSPLGAPGAWPPELATAVSMAVSSAFPMFVAWGAELCFLYNDAYIPILGDKHPGAFGRPFREVWSEIWHELVPILDRALSDKPVYFEDLALTLERRGYPEPAWFTFSYAPLHDGQGRVAGMYCTCNETTGRVQAERRAAFELAVADALRTAGSAEEAIGTASRLLGEELGLARVLYGEVDEARGAFRVPRDWRRRGLDALAGRDFAIDAFGAAVGRAGRAGAVVAVADVAADARTAANRAAYALLDAGAILLVPLVNTGHLLAFLALAHDRPHRWSEAEIALARSLGERIRTAANLARTDAALREERDRSQVILDSIAEGFVLIDRDWIVRQMNAEGLRLSNRTAEQVIGHDHWEIWPENLDSPVSRMYYQVMRERVPGRTEFRFEQPGREATWFEVRAYPARDGGLVGFFLDITERKLAEARLRAADQRKDEFLAMLAHELRNPLAPISAAADLLRIGRLDEARVRQSSAIIGRQVRHMTRLVDDLLDVSRVTRGLIELERSLLDVRAVVDEAVEQVRPQLGARRQRLALHLPSQPLMVEGDRARLVQVLANLLGNAVKYTLDDGAIGVQAEAREGKLVLTVSDNGIGMEPELTARAFDLFAQAKRSSDRSQGGLGLGLALVRNLVELHGGTVTCASPGLGQGSTFTLTLPLAASAVAVQPQPGAASRRAGGLRLLVVDDNVDAATTLAMLLEASGHEVFIEHESLRALELARSARPDACLLDIGLPDIDGNELARRLRAQPETAHSVLIAVSGYGQEADRRLALDAGFAHHLVKPVDLDGLMAVLATVRPDTRDAA